MRVTQHTLLRGTLQPDGKPRIHTQVLLSSAIPISGSKIRITTVAAAVAA